MRGLKKTAPDGADRHTDEQTSQRDKVIPSCVLGQVTDELISSLDAADAPGADMSRRHAK